MVNFLSSKKVHIYCLHSTTTMYLAKVQCSCWNIFARFLLTLTLQAEILCYKSLQTQTFLKGTILAAQKLACSCCFWLFRQ